MEKVKSYTVENIQQTETLAGELAQLFKPGDIIFLEGNLGSGKTLLVQKICAAWKVSEAVTSPTFTLIQHYDSGEVPVVHMDLYRLDRVEQLDQLGWEDAMSGDVVTFIEWPELIKPLIQNYYHVRINVAEDRRLFEVFRREKA